MQAQILYEDNHVLVINKKPSQLVQADKTKDLCLIDLLKNFLKERDQKPGNVFLGLVHRIDRPVSGAVMFAKTSKALGRLNEDFKERKIIKKYWALLEKNQPLALEDTLIHYLKKDEKNNKSFIRKANDCQAKKAVLSYKILQKLEHYYWVEISLGTGRHHQIRAQFSALGLPLQADVKYGAKRSNPDGSIALHAFQVEFIHPVSKKRIEIFAEPYDNALWSLLKRNNYFQCYAEK